LKHNNKKKKKMKKAPLILTTIGLALTSMWCASAQLPPQGATLSPLYLFQNTEEVENLPLRVEGKIPTWLEGEFVRNGPGIVRDTRGEYVKSWFDGLAKLHAFTIKGGRVLYTCKFLLSEPYRRLKATGEFDFLGFAEQPKTDQFSFIDFIFGLKNEELTNANVNVAKINNTLVALTEIPLPVAFDRNLNTLGYFDYTDSLTKNYSFESAHVLKDPDTQDTWNFLIDIGLLETTYQIYKIPHCSRERQLVASIPVSSISYMHSFALAGRYLILVDYPLRANHPTDLAHKFIQAFSWNKQSPTVVYVINKETGKCRAFLMDPIFSFHFVNGFEKGGKLFVDLIAYPSAEIISTVNYYPLLRDPGNRLLRLEIDLTKNTMLTHRPSREQMEFPRLNEELIGKEYQYFYAVQTQQNRHGLIKFDRLTSRHMYWLQPETYANEPIFISHPLARTEDDGVILSIINDLNTKKSFLLILDATTFKEIARVHVPHAIPFGFHGQFFREE
jgi:beta,beta-carotene 9',10'-dioxygenase